MSTEHSTATMDHQSDMANLCCAVTQRAPIPMAAIEGNGLMVRCVNRAFCRLLDKTEDQLIGQPFREFLPECVSVLERVYRTGKAESHTGPHRSNRQPIFWSYTVWPVVAHEHAAGVIIQVTETAAAHEKTLAMNEALLLGSVRQHELTEAADSSNAHLQKEISVRKQAEEALRRAQAKLTEHAGQLENLVSERTSELSATNSQLEAFVYSIAHDLRAPLRAMQGFATLLVEEEGAALSETGKSYAHSISKSAQYMDALLRDLLEFSRISQQSVELAQVKLEKVVESVLSHLQADIQARNARVESTGPWPLVLAHEATLSQVFFNLVSNALKFVVPGVPPVIRLRTEDRGEFIRVWVEDNGPGILPDHQSQIFRLFTRLHGEKYPGTGIGLAIVHKGVERMRGQAGVESLPGQGSRFWFELKPAVESGGLPAATRSNLATPTTT